VRRVKADAHGIEEAAAVIGRGGVVVIPTDTLYGVAADPFNADAVARVFEIKGRPADRALPLIASDADQIAARLGPLSPAAQQLADAFWPGALTLLLDAPASLAASVAAGTGQVGVRVPAHGAARALCRACGIPLIATSANISDQPATNDPDVVARMLGSRIDLLLDGGRTPGGLASTVVDATGMTPRLVRSGAVGWDRVLACMQRE
jgi:L-threonylcarbamoyladenylate synthase